MHGLLHFAVLWGSAVAYHTFLMIVLTKLIIVQIVVKPFLESMQNVSI